MDKHHDKITKQNLLYQLQKKILYQSLHDLQSPLSAVSGYLELMQICSDGDKDFNKMDRYRKNIQSGVEEVNEIIDQIRYLEIKTAEDERSGDYDVSLSWFLGDLCFQASSFADSKEQKVIFTDSETECYLKKNVSLVRLFLYNIIIGLLKYVPKGGMIKLSYETSESGVAITFSGQEFVRPASKIVQEILTDRESTLPVSQNHHQSSEKQTVDRAMEQLHCSLSSESVDPSEVTIQAFFKGHTILSENE